jgi:hypothetical protein
MEESEMSYRFKITLWVLCIPTLSAAVVLLVIKPLLKVTPTHSLELLQERDNLFTALYKVNHKPSSYTLDIESAGFVYECLLPFD